MTRHHLITLGIAAILFLVGPPPVCASADDAVCVVSVGDPRGPAIAGASVDLIRDGADAAHAATDARGSFHFADVRPGRYQIRAAAPGFETRTSGQVFVGAGALVTLDVTLAIGPLQQDVVVTASATALPQSQVGAAV